VSGMVENMALRSWKETKGKTAETLASEKDKRRNLVKFEWCYGATEKRPLYGNGHQNAALQDKANLSSPYEMEIPDAVRSGSQSSSNWLRCSGFQFSDLNWENAVPGREKAAPALGKDIVAAKPVEQDESLVDVPADVEAQAPGVSGKAKKKAKKIFEKIKSLFKNVVAFMLPKIDAVSGLLKDIGHASTDFLDKWVGEIRAMVEPIWEGAKTIKADLEKMTDVLRAKYEEAKKVVLDLRAAAQKTIQDIKDEAQKKIDAAKDAFHKAEVFMQGKVGEALKKAEDDKNKMREEFDKAKKDWGQKVTDVLKALQGDDKDKMKLVDEAGKSLTKYLGAELKKLIKEKVFDYVKLKVGELGSKILGKLLEELVGIISKRALGPLEPKARELLSRGFKLVREVLGPIAKAVIGALGSIPFVGGALAPIGAVLYDLAMDKLEELIFSSFMGLVERFIGKTLRPIIAALFNMVKGKLLELVNSLCAKIAPGICPKEGLKFAALPEKDRWIERALACNRPPIIGPEEHRQSALAFQRIQSTSAEMQREVLVYTREIADEHLAKYGHTYNSWMAYAKSGIPSPMLAQQAADIRRGLATAMEELKREITNAR
jgi:hypothetical protein